MSLATLSGLGTAVLLLAFIGLCVWAFSPRQKRRWDESAALPFLDDDMPRGGGRDEERHHD